MRWRDLPGPSGRGQGHAGRAARRAARRARRSRPATCCARPSRQGTPLGLQAKAVMERGRARPRRPDDRHRPGAARPAGRRGRASSSTASRGPCAGQALEPLDDGILAVEWRRARRRLINLFRAGGRSLDATAGCAGALAAREHRADDRPERGARAAARSTTSRPSPWSSSTGTGGVLRRRATASGRSPRSPSGSIGRSAARRSQRGARDHGPQTGRAAQARGGVPRSCSRRSTSWRRPWRRA